MKLGDTNLNLAPTPGCRRT